jgi:zinc/manganese transport system substrate-binding protein
MSFPRSRRLVVRGAAGLAALVLLIPLTSQRASSAPAQAQHAGKVLHIVVAENVWGSIVKQEAGAHAQVISIITNPNADPHSYEPTTGDARLMAQAQYVVFNGAGYDPWLQKLLSANPVHGRAVLNVGDLIGKKEGDNPHLWYSPSYVIRVANQVTADLRRLDRSDAGYFARQHDHFVKSTLRPYFQEIATIGRKYHGVPVGATESIFVYLASALKLALITPPGFMKALSEGTEPTAQAKAAFDDQVTNRQIKVFVYNIQNSTPDTTSLEQKARSAGIPIVPITETLQPASASFQAWQLAELKSLARALAKATGH